MNEEPKVLKVSLAKDLKTGDLTVEIEQEIAASELGHGDWIDDFLYEVGKQLEVLCARLDDAHGR